jgi:1-acyl-sn-glycerol-3-phosphate acyltransferase
MLWIFSYVYWAFFALTLPVMFLVACLVWLVTLPFDRRRVALHLWSCAWATFYVVANPFWRVRVLGRARLPWRGPAILVANHLSLLDILVVYGVFRPFKWVAKAELFKLPFVGWNMRLNDYVPIWRGDRESVKRMLVHCRAHLARGTPVLIFPEGTRSKDGHLQAFKDGAFRLALDAGVPVVPIAITGTSDALPKHGMVLLRPMNAEVRVLDPIRPEDFPSIDGLREAARAALTAALPEQNRPAPPRAPDAPRAAGPAR